jgi:hypothetical protein
LPQTAEFRRAGGARLRLGRRGDAAVGLLERLAVAVPRLPPAAIARQPYSTVPLRDHPGFRALAARLEAQMAAAKLE